MHAGRIALNIFLFHFRYIMLSIEAPIYLYEYRDLSSLHFNWTMTYRLDSDFPIPYAWIEQTMPLPAPIGSARMQRFITQGGCDLKH
jgi:hypothetical protein